MEWEGTTYVASGFELGAWRLEECDEGVLLRRSVGDPQVFFPVAIAPTFDEAKALAEGLQNVFDGTDLVSREAINAAFKKALEISGNAGEPRLALEVMRDILLAENR